MAKAEVTVHLNFDPPIQKIEVLRLEPGDILACTVPDSLSETDAARLRSQLRAGMPEGVRVLIVERAELSVIRPSLGAS